jgi:hypothetical protein
VTVHIQVYVSCRQHRFWTHLQDWSVLGSMHATVCNTVDSMRVGTNAGFFMLCSTGECCEWRWFTVRQFCTAPTEVPFCIYTALLFLRPQCHTTRVLPTVTFVLMLRAAAAAAVGRTLSTALAPTSGSVACVHSIANGACRGRVSLLAFVLELSAAPRFCSEDLVRCGNRGLACS